MRLTTKDTVTRSSPAPTPPLPVAPELSSPATGGGNYAATTEIGHSNKSAQIQSGRNNRSSVGVAGNGNKVGVLQGGNDLSSVMLVGTQGLNIGVIQPPGSAPVNLLIARLPNGSLLIKR